MSDAAATPEVTVVIPTHNRWSLLPRTLRGALDQAGVDHEVVVVVDGSKDGTVEGLAAIDDPRLRVVVHEPAGGVARARNAGIAAARAPWVAFLDDDDLWAPGKLRAQLDAAERAGAGWSWTAMLGVDADLEPVLAYRSPEPDGIARRLLEYSPIPAPSTVMVRTDLLRQVGGFDPGFSAYADWDLYLRVSVLCEGAGVPEVLVGYVEHAQNMLAGATDADRVRPEFERLAAKHGARAAEAGVRFGNQTWTRWVASRERLAGRPVAAARVYLRGAARNGHRGDLVRAVGALGGERIWQRVRARVVAPAVAPDWLRAYAG